MNLLPQHRRNCQTNPKKKALWMFVRVKYFELKKIVNKVKHTYFWGRIIVWFLRENIIRDCCCSGQEQKALASRVALIKWREQAQQFKFPPTKRAVASLSLLIGPRHSSPALFFFLKPADPLFRLGICPQKYYRVYMRQTARRHNRT